MLHAIPVSELARRVQPLSGTLYLSQPEFDVVVAHPLARWSLWKDYIDGARKAYTRHGCKAALDYRAVAGGEGTAVFFAVVDRSGQVVGGLRVQQPLGSAAASHAVEEWAGQDGQIDLVNAIEARLSEGIAEVKTAWVDERSPLAMEIAAQLARLALPIMNYCGVRYMMATAAEHVLKRWESGGGRVSTDVSPTPYPTKRYTTRLMWWDSQTIAADADPQVWCEIEDDMSRFTPRRRRSLA
ncbi:hypothetical protein [Gordonia rhizosphera]|uniref:N-acetyltransferase domain-containing protein n=1 Tax=Gordonia rhizosphera NBRC 16068 TaxID=1108045 RepID=K6VY43_9ACTN|nr:hypothetical protein [Gordonia rhizosphera]GAB91800.1 hypothetical protein GORHZ_149_00060 [Gordonia rhizosphera NBRC 16068]